MDTIYAPSTPIGGAIAVIRASGPDCARALTALSGRDLTAVPRQVTHTPLYFSGAVIDDAMAVYYAAPRSYTGEDMFELYCHGGPAVVRDVLAALNSLTLRAAEPGEFTRRAFLNGKLDLAQAEAVMDLIQSSAQRAARAALEQMQGRLSRELAAVEDALTDALAGVSAAIDYPTSWRRTCSPAADALSGLSPRWTRSSRRGARAACCARACAWCCWAGPTRAIQLLNALPA